MPFIRSILLIFLIFLMWRLWKILNRRSQNLKKQQSSSPPKPSTETLLRCAHCGTHILKQEVIYSENGQAFCCQAHKDAMK